MLGKASRFAARRLTGGVLQPAQVMLTQVCSGRCSKRPPRPDVLLLVSCETLPTLDGPSLAMSCGEQEISGQV